MCWLMPTIPTFRGGWRFPSEYSLGCIRKNSPTRPCFKNNIFNWRKENILQVFCFVFVCFFHCACFSFVLQPWEIPPGPQMCSASSILCINPTLDLLSEIGYVVQASLERAVLLSLASACFCQDHATTASLASVFANTLPVAAQPSLAGFEFPGLLPSPPSRST